MLLEQHSIVLAGILGAAIGVMDQAGRWTPRGKRLLQGLHRQAGPQMVIDRPTHHLAAEGIEHDGEIDEALAQSDVGDVGHPDLIRTGRLQPAHQVRDDRPGVVRARRHRHKRPMPQAQQIVLAHQPPHPLVVHHHALPAQHRRHPAIAVVSIGQRHTLHLIAHRRLLLHAAPTPANAGSSSPGSPSAARTSGSPSVGLAGKPPGSRRAPRRRCVGLGDRPAHLLHKPQGFS